MHAGRLLGGVVAVASLLAAASAGAQPRNDGFVHNGAATCASAGCHELTSPAAGSDIDRTEYALWSQGPHAQAFRALETEQAARIARNMGLGPAPQAEFCLSCHAGFVPPERQGPEYTLADGVSCESCHGGSGQWLEKHTDLEFTLQDLQAHGLYPTWDPVARAEMCLDCHLGARDQFAGHRLMGAGHPRVSFELDSYTEINAHHTVDADYLERKPYVDGMRTWAIGQAMTIARRMELLADSRTGTVGFFPEFVFFDCRGCHQPMSASRQVQGNGRGQPRLDVAHIEMLLIAARRADPALADRIRADLARLHGAATQGRDALVAAAASMRDTAREAVDLLASHEFTAAEMHDIMRGLAAAAAEGRFADYSSAEQVTLALDTTLAAMSISGALDDAEYDRLHAALDPVFVSVQSDEDFTPGRFASAMQGFRAAVE